MRTFKGGPKENFVDFAEEILYSCNKLLFEDEEEKVGYLRGFLEGEAAEFLTATGMPHKSKYTLNELLKKINGRFMDSRTQSDFLYMLTRKRHNKKLRWFGNTQIPSTIWSGEHTQVCLTNQDCRS